MLIGFGKDGVEFGPDSAPVAFRLFRFGANANENYAPVIFDEAAAERVMARYREVGNRLSIDYEHAQIRPETTVEERRSAGSFVPEVRTDRLGNPELWATRIRWTPKGREAVISGEYRSMSPAWQSGTEGEILCLTNVALTSTPAMHHAPDLSLRAASVAKPKQSADQVLILNLVKSDDDILRALRAAGHNPEAALRTVASNPHHHEAIRRVANRVLARQAARANLDARMGINTAAASVENRGRVQTFHTRGVAR